MDFVLFITSSAVYGPEVDIFLGVGPMTDAYAAPVVEVVANSTARGLKVHFLNQSGVSHSDCGHPSYQADAQLAARAGAFISATLKWGSL